MGSWLWLMAHGSWLMAKWLMANAHANPNNPNNPNNDGNSLLLTLLLLPSSLQLLDD